MLDNLGISNSVYGFRINSDNEFAEFINDCNKASTDFNETFREEFTEEFPTTINSKYYNLNEINQIKHDKKSSFGLLHTNLAPVSKHFDDLEQVVSLLKTNFDIIGTTEHKLPFEHSTPLKYIKIPGYHPFVFDCSNTFHGGSGIFIKNSLVSKKRDDLKISSSGDFESTFIELIFPQKRNMIIGCIYRHPSSNITIKHFTQDFMEPLLSKIVSEEKICAIMGDFNIDLIKNDKPDEINMFYNNLTSNLLNPFILQPTRLVSKNKKNETRQNKSRKHCTISINICD